MTRKAGTTPPYPPKKGIGALASSDRVLGFKGGGGIYNPRSPNTPTTPQGSPSFPKVPSVPTYPPFNPLPYNVGIFPNSTLRNLYIPRTGSGLNDVVSVHSLVLNLRGSTQRTIPTP